MNEFRIMFWALVAMFAFSLFMSLAAFGWLLGKHIVKRCLYGQEPKPQVKKRADLRVV